MPSYFVYALLAVSGGLFGALLGLLTRYRSWTYRWSIVVGLNVLAWAALLTCFWEPAKRLWLETVWPWLDSWVQTSGFAGVTALLAAGVTALTSIRKHRRDAWWSRAQWCLDHYLAGDGSTSGQRSAALAALDALQSSDLAKKSELEFVLAVTDVVLDPMQDGDETDDLAPDGGSDDGKPVDEPVGMPVDGAHGFGDTGHQRVDEG